MYKFSNPRDQNLIINGAFVSGVQELDISIPKNLLLSPKVDNKDIEYFVSGPIVPKLRVKQYLNEQNIFSSLTGNSSFSGAIDYIDKRILFFSGYMTRYSINVSENDFPQAIIEADIYSNISTGLNQKFIKNTGIEFQPFDPNFIDFNINETFTNRLKSMELAIESQRAPIYYVNTFSAQEVTSIYPLNISLSLDFEASEYQINNIYDVFSSISQLNLNINFKKHKTNTSAYRIDLSNFIQNANNFNLDLENNSKFRLEFNTHLY